jgi:2-methylcitrate dehydratase PrpD
MDIDPEMEKQAWKRGSRLTVKLKSGKSYQQEVEYCKGLAENPLTRDEFDGKFRGLAGVATSKDTVEHILGLVRDLGRLSDVSELVSLMVHRR